MELDHEWDTDRAVEIEAAMMGLMGLVLGTLVRKQFLALPAIVAGAVLVQATTGRYPLMPLFRRLGFRTSREIARERHALKALRGTRPSVNEPMRKSSVSRAPPRPTSNSGLASLTASGISNGCCRPMPP